MNTSISSNEFRRTEDILRTKFRWIMPIRRNGNAALDSMPLLGNNPDINKHHTDPVVCNGPDVYGTHGHVEIFRHHDDNPNPGRVGFNVDAIKLTLRSNTLRTAEHVRSKGAGTYSRAYRRLPHDKSEEVPVSHEERGARGSTADPTDCND